MNNDSYSTAFEMIKGGCEVIKNEPVRRSPVKKYIKYIVLTLAALILLAVMIPTALTAAGSGWAYDLLYSVSPAAAQKLTPVRSSCEDNGIRLEAGNAFINGSSAEIRLMLTDLEGGILNGKVSLSDESMFGTAFDSYGGCGCTSFSESDGKAELLALVLSADGEDIPAGKITVSFSRIMTMPKENIFPVSVDLSSLFRESEMKDAGHYASDPLMEATDGTVCADESGIIFDAGNGAAIVSSCFYNGRLHIKTRFDDFSSTKNRGRVYFISSDGEETGYVQDITYDDGKRGCRYEEYLFDVTPEQLTGCTMYFDTVTSDIIADGSWRGTVPVNQQ